METGQVKALRPQWGPLALNTNRGFRVSMQADCFFYKSESERRGKTKQLAGKINGTVFLNWIMP